MARDIIQDIIDEITKDAGKRNSLNNELRDNNITSFERLKNYFDSQKGLGGFDSDFDSDSIAGVKKLREQNKEAERLLKLLEQIKKTGMSEISAEDITLLKKLGLDEQDLEKSKDKIEELEKELSKVKQQSNFASRLNHTNNIINGITSSIKSVGYAISDLLKPYANLDAAASKYAKTVAMSHAGMKSLEKTTLNNVLNRHIGADYNVGTDELIAAQQSYVQAVGRSLRVNDEQQENIAAMHAVMQGKEIELASALENFGVDLNSTAEYAYDMFDTAAKRGVTFDKLSDNVAKNIKIAQNYTFRNGLKGLESMAAKAVALRMDMTQIAALADKVGTVEGSIDVASRLQVLGGPFANMADPLGMLNEGLNDMEGLMDRVTKMIGGLGSFNKQTGQVDVSSFNKKRVQAAAQAMGISYDNMMESVNAQAKREAIKKEISSSTNARSLNDDMKELLMNSASFDKKTGKYGVSINGEFKSIDQLKNSDYDILIKETQDEAADIKDIARTLRGYTDKVEGTRKQKEAVQAKLTSGIGEGIGNIISRIGRSNVLLGIIATAQSLMTISNGVSQFMGNARYFRAARGLGGARGIAGGAAAAGGGSTSRLAARRLLRRQARQKVMQSTIQTSATNTARAGIGGRLFGGVARTGAFNAGTEMLGSTALRLNQGAYNWGASMLGKGTARNQLGKFVISQANKSYARMGANVAMQTAKESGKRIAQKELTQQIGKTLLKNGVKSGGAGFALGIAGAGVDILNQHLTNKGTIKDGGFAQGAMTVGADALKGAGVGIMFGPWGAAIGAAVGATIGTVKAVAHASKVKRAKAVDAELSQLGIARKGDYGARSLKLIDKALQTGEISDRMRRKLLREGDTDILKQIEAKKNEVEEKEEAKKDREAERQALINQGNAYKNSGSAKSRIKKANIKVDVAYFGGKAFGENTENGNEKTDILKKLGDFGLNLMIPGVGVATKAMEDTLKLTAASLEPVKQVSDTIKVVAEKGESKESEKMQKIAEDKAAEEKRKAEEEKRKAEEAKRAEEQNQQTTLPPNTKFDVNITGTIKIEADGKLFNLDELANNDGFKQQVAKLISDQIDKNWSQTNVKERK